MIDINELRRLAQAATPGPDGVSLNWLKLLQDFQKEANPAVINELLDRLEAAESARRDDYQNWMTALDRNAELLAKLEAAKEDIALKERIIDALGSELNAVANERDAMRAKIEQMERQEPAALVKWQVGGLVVHIIGDAKAGDILYALPGAKGE